MSTITELELIKAYAKGLYSNGKYAKEEKNY